MLNLLQWRSSLLPIYGRCGQLRLSTAARERSFWHALRPSSFWSPRSFQLLKLLWLLCLPVLPLASARPATAQTATPNPATAPAAASAPALSPATQPPRTLAQAATAPPPALRVVLLLPLESALLRRAAVSVREGATAVLATRKADVSVSECSYNTDGVVAAYNRCVDGSVDWVIGPLGRSDVTTLALAKIQSLRPTLMLSPLGTVPPQPMSVLAPELEAEGETIAQQAVEDACRQPVLVEAGGAMASRVGVSILSFWRGRIATPLAQHALGSRETWRRLADGWRRDNVDCVLFAGGAGVLSELRPYLRGMTVYITSASYEATLDRTADWTGVRIADVPWLVDAERAEFAPYLPADVTTSAPSPTLARLYALGVDAARLVVAAGRDALPSTFDGAIGQLTLKDGQYRRQPMVGEFRERTLVKVAP